MYQNFIKTLGILPLLVGLIFISQFSYSQIIIDGSITESEWGSPLSTSLGGASPGFGAGHEINAIYVHGNLDSVFLGIAGNVQNDNRILIFIDSKSGGYSNGNFGRTNAPQGIDEFNSTSTFDDGFLPDYCLVIGTDISSNYYFDLYTLSGTAGGGGGSNNYLGNQTNVNLGASPFNSSQTRGFELKLSKILLGYVCGEIKVMAMYISDAGFLSNQFLTPAGGMEGNYGSGQVVFGAANPNPITVTPSEPLSIAGRDTAVCKGSFIDLRTLLSGSNVGNIRYGDAYGMYPDTITNLVSANVTKTYYILDSLYSGISSCNDTAQITITVKDTSLINISTTICKGSTIMFNGQTLSASGVYRDTFTNVMGCDSFVVLNLHINEIIAGIIVPPMDTVFCLSGNPDRIDGDGTNGSQMATGSGAISYQWQSSMDNINFNNLGGAAGQNINYNPAILANDRWYRRIDTSTLSGVFCLDTTNTIKFTFLEPPVITGMDTTVCQGSSLDLRSLITGDLKEDVYYSPTFGTYTDTITKPVVASATNTYFIRDSIPLSTCTDTAKIVVTVKDTSRFVIDSTICRGDFIAFNGQTITSAGSYRDTLANAMMCDSFIVLNVTVKDTSRFVIDSTICRGDFIAFNGQTITSAGTYRDTLANAMMCDSFIVLNVTVKDTSRFVIDSTICWGDFIAFNGQTITSAGSYRDTLANAMQCDSFIVLNVTVKDTSRFVIDSTICQGDFIAFNGQTITSAGTYRDTLVNAIMCDSFIVLNVTVKDTSRFVIDSTICRGDFIAFNGQTITNAGTYRDTLLNAMQCDSFIVLNVTVKDTSRFVIDSTICQGDFIAFNGQTITSAGTYRDTTANAMMCDSFIVLNVTVKDTSRFVIDSTICQGDFISFNEQTITSAGTYRDTMANAMMCDSFIVLNVTLKDTSRFVIDSTICRGDFIAFNEQTIKTAGTYRDTVDNAMMCDSFIVLNVTLKDTSRFVIDSTICQGDFIAFNGQTITSTGSYRDTLTNVMQCDSFIVLNVTVKDTSRFVIDSTICQGDFIAFNGHTITSAGSYRDTLSNAMQCDSFIVLNVSVKDTSRFVIDSTICQGDFIAFNGHTITSAGSYRDTLSNAMQCDSFIVLNVIVKDTSRFVIDSTICRGDFIAFNGQTITSAGSYRDTLTNAMMCDSFIVLNVTVKDTSRFVIDSTICQGDFIAFNGQTITSAGSYRDTLTNAMMCDSFIVLNVTVKDTSRFVIDSTICQGDFIAFNGQTITSAGIYRDTLANAMICDSFIVLNVTVKDTSRLVIDSMICQGDFIAFNGQTITTAGTYRDTFSNAMMCDSFIVFNVTVIAKAPEIVVFGNNVIISNNDFQPSNADHTDFGSVYTIGESVSRIFTIKNIGSEQLVLGSNPVSLGSSSSGAFMVISQPNTSIAPGDSSIFEIKFDPSVVDDVLDTIYIANNDADESPFAFVVRGSGLNITLSAASERFLDFGDPCSCSDPLNFESGGIYYFHDTLTVFSTPRVSGLNLTINSVTSGFYVGTQGSVMIASSGTPILETPSGSGIYKIEFWRPSGSIPILEISDGGSIVMVPVSTFEPACIIEACEVANIPTLSQWAMILLGLLLLIPCVIMLRYQESTIF